MILLYRVQQTKEIFNDTVQKILKKTTYNKLTNRKTFLELIQQWVEDKIRWIIESFFGKSSGYTVDFSKSWISSIIFFILVVLFAVLIGVIIWYVRKLLVRNRRVKRILGEIIDEQTTYETLYNKALKDENTQDFRNAVRYFFIALLLKLEEHHLLHIEEDQTNREIVAALRDKGFEQMNRFEKVVNTFNLIWYGHAEIYSLQFEEWKSEFDVLWQEV